MEIKITGKSALAHQDPFVVPKALVKKYPEAEWCFVAMVPKNIRHRLDMGYQFVPAKEVGSFQGRVGRNAIEMGIPEDVFCVGDTVLMVCHKKDHEARMNAMEKEIQSKRQSVKPKMLDGVKDLDSRIGVIGEGVKKDAPEEGLE
jgi:hypothetical protein